MSKISIESIQQALNESGWHLLSTEYKNLDTPLEFQCNEGHSVYAPWGKLRNKLVCPICNSNQFKIQDETIIPKSAAKRILALDQASHLTGWSIFDDQQLVKYGVFKVESLEEIERFHKVKEWLISMIHL